MRLLIYYIATSLDGYIATVDGGVDSFLMEGPHADDFVKTLATFETVLMGGNTYRFGFAYGLKPGDPAYPGLKHVVFSRSLSFPSTPDVTLSTDDPVETVRVEKERNGGPIWLCGGGALAGSLATAGLIDEYWIKVNPILLGSGIPLLGNHRAESSLTLAGMTPYENGVVLMKYRVRPSGT